MRRPDHNTKGGASQEAETSLDEAGVSTLADLEVSDLVQAIAHLARRRASVENQARVVNGDERSRQPFLKADTEALPRVRSPTVWDDTTAGSSAVQRNPVTMFLIGSAFPWRTR